MAGDFAAGLISPHPSETSPSSCRRRAGPSLKDGSAGTTETDTARVHATVGMAEGEKVWYKRKDDPLGIFTDPVQMSPGHAKTPDGVGVWVKDFGRSIFEV